MVYPNNVRSKNDNDQHFIGFARLCELWGLNPLARNTIDASNERQYLGLRLEDYEVRHYHVRHDGKYKR